MQNNIKNIFFFILLENYTSIRLYIVPFIRRSPFMILIELFMARDILFRVQNSKKQINIKTIQEKEMVKYLKKEDNSSL